MTEHGLRPAPDVFVINTPLQLLNAIEASAAYGSVDPHLLILYWECWPRRAFAGLLASSRWSSVTWVPLDIYRPTWKFPPLGLSDRLAEYVWTWRRAGQRRTLESAFAVYGTSIDRLAIGNYCQPFMRHVLNTVPHRRAVALDDGTDALKAAEQRRQAFEGGASRDSAAPPGLKGRVGARWVDMNSAHPKSALEFFSVYDLPLTLATTLRRHKFEQLRNTLRYSAKGSEVFFLGQPLLEDGYVSAGDLATLLRDVERYYAGRELIYVPHKRETSLSLDVVRGLGLNLVEFDDPIEIVLTTGRRQPRILSSFFCSALENCGILLGDALTIHAVKIPTSMLLDAREEVARIYAYLGRSKSAAITLIDL